MTEVKERPDDLTSQIVSRIRTIKTVAQRTSIGQKVATWAKNQPETWLQDSVQEFTHGLDFLNPFLQDPDYRLKNPCPEIESLATNLLRHGVNRLPRLADLSALATAQAGLVTEQETYSHPRFTQAMLVDALETISDNLAGEGNQWMAEQPEAPLQSVFAHCYGLFLAKFLSQPDLHPQFMAAFAKARKMLKRLEPAFAEKAVSYDLPKDHIWEVYVSTFLSDTLGIDHKLGQVRTTQIQNLKFTPPVCNSFTPKETAKNDPLSGHFLTISF